MALRKVAAIHFNLINLMFFTFSTTKMSQPERLITDLVNKIDELKSRDLNDPEKVEYYDRILAGVLENFYRQILSQTSKSLNQLHPLDDLPLVLRNLPLMQLIRLRMVSKHLLIAVHQACKYVKSMKITDSPYGWRREGTPFADDVVIVNYQAAD